MPTYKAFISYGHESDRTLAPVLQSSLERFAKPWYRARAFRIFRDSSNLSVSPELWPDIEKALSESEYLLLLASPKAGNSPWVARELAYWRHQKDLKKLLIVLTSGTIAWSERQDDFDWQRTTAIPDVLREAYKFEPFYVDLSGFRDAKLTLDDPVYVDHVASIAAALHGKSKDEIFGEHLRERHKTMRTVQAVAGVLTVLLVLAVVLAGLAYRQYRVAEARRLEAESETRVATAQRLAAQSGEALSDGLPQRALILAAEALKTPRPGDPQVPAPEQALRDAVSAVSGHPLRGTPSVVTALATTPDGQQLITGEADGTIHLWNLDQTPPLRASAELRGHQRVVMAMAISADGTRLISGSADHSARLWDLQAKRLMAVLPDLGGEVTSVAVDPQARFAIIASSGGPPRFWNLSDPDGFSDPDRLVPLSAHADDGAADLAVSASGRWLATAGGSDATAQLWKFRSPSSLESGHVLRANAGNVSVVAISGDERWLVAGEDQGAVQLWRLNASGIAAAPILLTGHESSVSSVAFSGDGRWLVTGSWDRTARLWDLREDPRDSGAIVLRGHQDMVTSTAFSADSKWIATSSYDGTARLWNLTSTDPSQRPRVLRGHEGGVTTLAFASGWLISAGDADSARRWSLNGTDSSQAMLRLRGTGSGHEEDGVQLSDSPGAETIVRTSGQRLFTGHKGLYAGTVAAARVWDLSKPGVPPPFRTLSRSNSLKCGDFSSDGRWLAIGDEEGFLRLWNMESSGDAPVVELRAYEDALEHVILSPDLRWIVTLGWLDSNIKVWRWDGRSTIQGPSVISRAEYGSERPYIAFTRDGHWMVSASSELQSERDEQYTVQLWDMSAVDPTASPRSLKGHTNVVQAVTSTRDGRWLFTGSRDGTARRWDLRASAPAESGAVFSL